MKEFETDPDTRWTQVESDKEVRDRAVEFLNEIGKLVLQSARRR